MSFFDPVYSNDQIGIDEDLLADGIPRPSFEKSNRTESHGRLDTAPDQSSEVKYSIESSLIDFVLLNFS